VPVSGWAAQCGRGMAPNVFPRVGLDPDSHGIRVGMGLERIAMLRHGFRRSGCSQNDVRFLEHSRRRREADPARPCSPDRDRGDRVRGSDVWTSWSWITCTRGSSSSSPAHPELLTQLGVLTACPPGTGATGWTTTRSRGRVELAVREDNLARLRPTTSRMSPRSALVRRHEHFSATRSRASRFRNHTTRSTSCWIPDNLPNFLLSTQPSRPARRGAYVAAWRRRGRLRRHLERLRCREKGIVPRARARA